MVIGNIEIDLSFVYSLLNNPFVQMGLGLFVLILLFVIVIFTIRLFVLGKSKTAKAFQKRVILVTVPKELNDKKDAQPLSLQQIQEKIGVMESFFSTIAGQKSEKGFKAWFLGHRDVFAFEFVVVNGKIHFYIAVPEHLYDYIHEQINAQFTHAFIEEVPDYNVFSPKGFIKGTMLKLVHPDFLPIKTYKKLEADPLNVITNALSNIDEKDGAAIQIVIKSARPSWRKFGLKIASKMQQGKKYEDAWREVKGGVWGWLSGMAKAGKPKTEGQPPEQYRLSPLEEEMVKGIEETCNKAGADVNIRIVVSSQNQTKLDVYLNASSLSSGHLRKRAGRDKRSYRRSQPVAETDPEIFQRVNTAHDQNRDLYSGLPDRYTLFGKRHPQTVYSLLFENPAYGDSPVAVSVGLHDR